MRRPLCLLCVFYVVTVMIFPRLFLPRDSEKIPPGGAYVVYTGEVYAIENQDDKSVVYLKSASAADSETVLVSDIICYFGDTSFTSGLKIGNWARIGGTCRPFRSAANDGQFDAKQYYRILEWDFAMTGCEGSVTDETYRAGAQALYLIRERLAESFDRGLPSEDAGVMKAMLLGQKKDLDDEIKGLYQRNGIAHILAISGVKTLKLDIPLVPENRINWAFVPLHIVIIYILKLCLDEEIIPRCRFPCSRGYHKKYINWQKKQ